MKLSYEQRGVLNKLKQYLNNEEHTLRIQEHLQMGNVKEAHDLNDLSEIVTDSSFQHKRWRGYGINSSSNNFQRTDHSDYNVMLKNIDNNEDITNIQKPKSSNHEDSKKFYKREITFSDANWSDQWQYSQSPSMYITEAWNNGYNGTGITIAIVDDGIDFTHDDLLPNINKVLSYNLLNSSNDANHQFATDGHGTKCAGIVAAVKNDRCIVGVAYGASLVAYRIFGERQPSTEDQAVALIYGLQDVDIYSNSWGPKDDGKSFYSLDPLVVAAFDMGTKQSYWVANEVFYYCFTQGRGGRGLIYVWASGNGGQYMDDCNADGYSKSRYTIAIGSVSSTGEQTFYSEKCAAILAATYSGDKMKQITTTNRGSTCAANFTGSTASAPTAAGMIGLMLQANNFLTWRDVQHIIVETSSLDNLNVSLNIQTNGADKQFNEYLGFGLMNASAMIDTAISWLTVPASIQCIPSASKVIDSFSFHETINATIEVKEDCYIRYLEWVELMVLYSGYYRGDMTFDLVSPLSTDSTIFHQRYYDTANLTTLTTTTFMSVRYWGENPVGNWTLYVKDQSSSLDTYMFIYSYRLTFYGTLTNPLQGTPERGSEGGPCNSTIECGEVLGCLINVNICVECTGSFREHKGFCVKDGDTNGYCDEKITCEYDGTDYCVNNTCILKPLDGSLGGLCNETIPCDNNATMLCVAHVCTLRPKDKEGVTATPPKHGAPSDKSNAGLIAGAVVGGILGVALISVGSYCAYIRLKTPRSKIHATTAGTVSPGFDFSLD
ncbi:pheromone processing endoprotease [Mactra antiquata]